MITVPILRFNGQASLLVSPGCGRTAMRNREVSFWQSRHPSHKQTPLADLQGLAREIRRTWPRA